MPSWKVKAKLGVKCMTAKNHILQCQMYTILSSSIQRTKPQIMAFKGCEIALSIAQWTNRYTDINWQCLEY